MIALLLALAAQAQETVASPDACSFTPVETPQPARPPDALAPSRDFVECAVTTEIDDQGRPTPKQVDGCDEPFASAARAGFATWRFQPCLLEDGRGIEGTVRLVAKFASSEFQLQGDAAYRGLMDMHEPDKAVSEGCAGSVRILPDGTVEKLTSSDVNHCISAARKRTLKHHYLELAKVTTCTVDFDVKSTRADQKKATVSGCEGDVAEYARNAVTSFPWNSPIAGTEHYSIRVILGPK